MIREFLFRAYLVVFASSVIFGFWVGFAGGGGNYFTGVGIALAVATFWLIVGWVCQPLFWNKLRIVEKNSFLSVLQFFFRIRFSEMKVGVKNTLPSIRVAMLKRKQLTRFITGQTSSTEMRQITNLWAQSWD